MPNGPEEFQDRQTKNNLKERLNIRQPADFSSATLRRLALTRMGKNR